MVSILLFLCLISTHMTMACNVLLPVNTFIAMGVLFYSYAKAQNPNFFVFSFACFSYGIGEIFWVLFEAMHIDPITNLVLSAIYFIPNCCFLIAFARFAYLHSNKWNLLQLSLDAFLIGTLNLMVIWIFFFDKNLNTVKAILEADVISIFSIILDVLLAMGIFSWNFSIRSGKIAFYDKVVFSGILLFIFDDLYYFFAKIHQLYIPNSYLDFLYILSLHIIAVGILFKSSTKEMLVNPTVVTNIGITNKWLFLLAYPLGVYILKGVVHEAKINLRDIFFLVIVIILYYVASKYLQLFIRLLAQEKEMNEILERRVAEQVAE